MSTKCDGQRAEYQWNERMALLERVWSPHAYEQGVPNDGTDGGQATHDTDNRPKASQWCDGEYIAVPQRG